MRYLTPEIANEFLSQLDMKIGEWNRINYMHVAPDWINYRAPGDAMQLFRFSQHVAGWLPKGRWKILQFDNSTSFDAVEAAFMKGFMNVSSVPWDTFLARDRTIIFEFNDDEQSNTDKELLISALIFICLLFEKYCYLVSSESSAGQLLGILDGFVYFHSEEPHLAAARELLRSFKLEPGSFPKWTLEIVAREQERILNAK